MKKLVQLALIVLLVGTMNGCFLFQDAGDDGTVIYGRDDRLDWYEIAEVKVRRNAEAVASSWNVTDLLGPFNWSYTLKTIKYSWAYNLVEEERFRDQQVGAHCTSFLVGEDILVTAGHCINRVNYKDKVFIFGYRMEGKGVKSTFIIQSENVYKAKALLAWELSSNGADYAVIKLDRKVKGVTPLKIRTSKVKKGEYVYVLGHPVGLPLKYAPNAKVLSCCNDYYFKASLDTYGGNSGSPVFDKDHNVVGILVRGETDFETLPSGKRRSAKGMFGESVTKASVWAKFVE